MANAEAHRIREYLLGQLTAAEEEQVELRLLTELDFAEEYDIVVSELTDDYIAGKFERDERAQMETQFFKSAERQKKLKFALALKKRKSELDADKSKKSWFKSYLAIAASLVLLAGGGFYIWRTLSINSDLNEGLAALQSAYRDERPLEARLAGFNYAPQANQRGQPAKADYVKRDLAASLLLRAATEHPSAESKRALGLYYLAEHQFDKATDQFQAALAVNPQDAEAHSDLAAALLETGKIQSLGSEKGREIETFARSLEHVNKALELNPSLLEAYFNRALLYQSMLLPRQAEAAWQEYLRQDPNSRWADEARRNLKELEENRRRTSQNKSDALSDFLAAYRARDDTSAWKVVSQNYTSAGNEVTNRLLDSVLDPGNNSSFRDTTLSALSYLAGLELSRSGDHYSSALVLQYERTVPKLRPVLSAARQHLKRGYDLFTQSKFTEAVGEYRDAKQEYERAGDTIETAFVDYLLAHCYIFLPATEKARLIFERLASIYARSEYRWLLAQSLYGLAHISADSSMYSKALDYSARALAKFEQAGDLNGILKCLTQLADFNQALNQNIKSFGYLNRGLSLEGDARSDPMQRWGMLVGMALSLGSLQLNAAALFYQEEALIVAIEMGRPLIIARSHGYVGSAFAAMKMYPQAVGEATKAFDIGRSIREGTGGVEIMANASQQLGDIHRQASDCAKAVEDYDTSIEYYGRLGLDYYGYLSHKGKLLCFMNTLADRAVSDELQTVFRLSENYRAKITAESQRNSFFDMEQSVFDLAINYESARMKDQIGAFQYSEDSRARSLLDAVHESAEARRKSYGPDPGLSAVTKAKSLNSIREMMPRGAQILQYAVLEDKLLMWIVNESGIHQEEVPIGVRALTEKVRAYLETINKLPIGDGADSPDQAQDLYRILIAPAEPFLDKSKFLCLVPDKILHFLPYSALISPTTSRYLIEDYNLGGAPSSSIFVDLSSAAQRKSGRFDERLLSVGNPHFDRAAFDLVDLPSSAREAQAISSFYKKSRVFLRDEARKSIIKDEMGKADVVHFAMHYVLNSQSEMLSGFPLTPERVTPNNSENSNGLLQSSEIYGMSLSRTRLVVLSACRTAIEQEYRGEGPVGAARPFLVAGVPTVVASLWSVDSGASAELMINFHRHRIREGLPVTEALRKAQVEMARGQSLLYRHPYYWAPFLTIGGQSPY